MTQPPTIQTQDDPLEHLLQQAFARELAQPVDESLIDQLTRRLHWQQKVRAGVLSVVLMLCMVFGSMVLLPALTELAGAITLPALAEFEAPNSSLVIVILLAVLVAPWLFALVDDPI
jgi:hypothetical protein